MFNFPNSPNPGDTYSSPAGTTYTFDGAVWIGPAGVTSVAGRTGIVVLTTSDLADFAAAAAAAARAAIPWEAGVCIGSVPLANEVIVYHEMRSNLRVGTNLLNWDLNAGVAATASSVFSVRKNGVQFGTITVAPGGTVGTLSGTQTDFANGDILSIIAPSSQDLTLQNIGITMIATRL